MINENEESIRIPFYIPAQRKGWLLVLHRPENGWPPLKVATERRLEWLHGQVAPRKAGVMR